jgi:hypothetical protein
MKFLYICSTLACVLILFPIHPIFFWVFAVIGAFVVSKCVIDKISEWK